MFIVSCILAFVTRYCASAVVEQIHLAQGRTAASMTISWITATKTPAVVHYSKLGEDERHKAIYGQTHTYNFTYPGYAEYHSGYIHHVTLFGLSPYTVYAYQCGDVAVGAEQGDVWTFRTLGDAGTQPSPITFGVVGDIGQTVSSVATVAHLAQHTILDGLDMVLHAGDLSYADCNQTMWDSFGRLIAPVARRRAWMVGPGNHEIELDPQGRVYVALEERYRMPAVRGAEYGDVLIPAAINPQTGMAYCCPSTFQSVYNYGNSFYSFDVGLTHIIYLNAYTRTDAGSAQYVWLETDLRGVNTKLTPWIVVVMHCPWYNSNKAHHNETQTYLMKEAMEPLFLKYGVAVAFMGHVHAYERTHPVYRDVVTAGAPLYVTIGDGGNLEGHASSYYDPAPSWSAFRNGTQYGFGLFTVYNRTHAHWVWYKNGGTTTDFRGNDEYWWVIG